jgi:hypothetical protein
MYAEVDLAVVQRARINLHIEEKATLESGIPNRRECDIASETVAFVDHLPCDARRPAVHPLPTLDGNHVVSFFSLFDVVAVVIGIMDCNHSLIAVRQQ